MQLCFFHDQFAKNFLPLTLSRPVFDLRVGILTIQEKWEIRLSSNFVSGIYDEYLYDVFPRQPINSNDECLWINARVLPSKKLSEQILGLPLNALLLINDVPVAARLDGEHSITQSEGNHFNVEGLTLIENQSSFSSINYLTDLLSLNGSEIESDIELLKLDSTDTLSSQNPESIFKNSEDIYIQESACIEPGSIIMADKGPVYIGANVTIEAGSILKGPVAICDGATVKMKARISDNTTIGPVCKVGGEISNSIFHSYSNKGHDGYVGNSIIGQWCNFGADTNTSNLKNNYTKVSLIDWSTKKASQESVQFLGTVMGDHSKTAINTMLNTGTICGLSSNIYAVGFPPKYIPSFSWLINENTDNYFFDKAIEAMKAMMSRRNITISSEYIDMMNYIYTNK